jgi:hypothetical protein
MTLTMPTREFVGLITDVLPFASTDDEDVAWHRVVFRWDGVRLHSMAGDGLRAATMSWGPDDDNEPQIPGLEFGPRSNAEPCHNPILPSEAKEIAQKFKPTQKGLGEVPVRIDGSADQLRVERDADGLVALRSVALSRPWSDNAPDIIAAIDEVEARARHASPRPWMAYSGSWLAPFADPRVVRQRAPLVLAFGPVTTYVRIGRWFRGFVLQDSSTQDHDND